MTFDLAPNIGISEGEWTSLCARSTNATPFHSWPWLQTWVEVYQPRRVWTLLALDQGEVVGAWPVCQRHLGAITGVGQGVSDYGGPILAGASMNEMVEALQGCFRRVNLAELPLGSGLSPATADLVHLQSKCPRISLPTTFEEFLRRLPSKGLKRDLTRSLADPNLKVTPSQGVDFADSLFDLHARLWASRWQPGVFRGRAGLFHRTFLEKANDAFGLLLKYQGQTIGALYGMRHGGTTYYYQSGYDPSFRHLSPGSRLVAEAIRQAISTGDHTFDFCRGQEAYKARFGATQFGTNYRMICGPLMSFSRTLFHVELSLKRRFNHLRP